MVRCHKCGSISPDDKKFCGDCGAKLSKAEAEKKDKKEAQKEATAPKAAAEKSAKHLPVNTAAFLVALFGAVSLVVLAVFIAMPKSGSDMANTIPILAKYCGDGVCNSNESCMDCPTDCSCPPGYMCSWTGCKVAVFCGNQVCDGNETCSSCPADCGLCRSSLGGPCSTDSDCSEGYCVNGLCVRSRPYCGNGICDFNETRIACSQDCGKPLSVGAPCTKNGDCKTGLCIGGRCNASSTYKLPSGYSVSWAPLDEEGFWAILTNATQSGSFYAPGGLYGLDVIYVNGSPQRYDYWRSYAAQHCLDVRFWGMSPQNIRAAAENPALNCERFKTTNNTMETPRQECNDTYAWCPPKGKCVRVWEEPCYEGL